MGTNYYHEREPLMTTRCTRCGGSLHCEPCEGDVRVHIGKSSAGWTFSFHATDMIRSYAEWLVALEAGGRIVDEYGRDITLDEFKEMVAGKRSAANNHARQHPTYSFVDAAGNSFSEGEFS